MLDSSKPLSRALPRARAMAGPEESIEVTCPPCPSTPLRRMPASEAEVEQRRQLLALVYNAKPGKVALTSGMKSGVSTMIAVGALQFTPQVVVEGDEAHHAVAVRRLRTAARA